MTGSRVCNRGLGILVEYRLNMESTNRILCGFGHVHVESGQPVLGGALN